MKKSLFSACLIALFAISPATGSEVSRKLGSLVQQLVTNYRDSRPAQDKRTIAVIPFTSGPDLARQKIGFAFSELVTHQLFREGRFHIVERVHVSSILEEQKLQQTGAIDSRTAAEVGKLLGAALVIVGSVEELGFMYQVNARLVEVESAGVLSTAYEEIPSRLFRDQAKPYLQLVPTQQTIGLYALFQLGGEVDVAGPINLPGRSLTLESFDLNMFGAGFRYFPLQRFMIDLGLLVPVENYRVGTLTSSSGSSTLTNELSLSSSKVIRAFLAYFSRSSERFSWHAGGGAARYDLFASSGGADVDFDLDDTGVFARTGIELRPQSRIGLGLSVMYFLNAPEGQIEKANDPVALELNPFLIESNLSFYF